MYSRIVTKYKSCVLLYSTTQVLALAYLAALQCNRVTVKNYVKADSNNKAMLLYRVEMGIQNNKS